MWSLDYAGQTTGRSISWLLMPWLLDGIAGSSARMILSMWYGKGLVFLESKSQKPVMVPCWETISNANANINVSWRMEISTRRAKPNMHVFVLRCSIAPALKVVVPMNTAQKTSAIPPPIAVVMAARTASVMQTVTANPSPAASSPSSVRQLMPALWTITWATQPASIIWRSAVHCVTLTGGKDLVGRIISRLMMRCRMIRWRGKGQGIGLTHCGLLTPYDNTDLGQHWFR